VTGVEIVAATTPFLVDGRAVGSSPGAPFALPPGSTIVTGGAVVRIRTASGDEVELSRGSELRSEGTLAEVEHLLLLSGEAEGRIGERTSLGAPAGWVSPPAGASAEVRVTVHAPVDGLPSGGKTEGASIVEAVRGAVWIRCAAADVWVPQGARAVLRVPGREARPLDFEALVGPGPPFTVLAGRGTSSETAAEVPSGYAGSVERAPRTGTTRWSCKQAPAGGSLGVAFRTKPRERACARLAPGVACVVDERGSARIEIEGAPAGTLDRLLALDDEFDAR